MESAVIALASSYLLGVNPDSAALLAMSEKDLGNMLEFASGQGILPLVMGTIEQMEGNWPLMSSRTFLEYFGASEKNRDMHNLKLEVMRKLCGLFRDKGIDVMFIKGETLAQLYPDPARRVSGDIDFYLFGKYADGESAMAGKGIKSKNYFHHHTQASLNGVLLENHYDFIDRENHRCNLQLDDRLKELAETEGRRYPFIFEGSYAMTPTMNALFLMRHMSAHFGSETVILRQLYDWVLFLRHQSSDVDWTLVLDYYRSSGMMRFAGIVQAIVEDKLKFGAVECPIEAVRGELTEKVWNSIIYPEVANEAKKNSIAYWVREFRMFVNNRWKHKLAYPGESYTALFFNYLKLIAGRFVKKA